MNNYFADSFIAWEPNLDIQPVFNHYEVVAYMCAYLPKSEDECSLAMKEAVEDAFEKKLNNYNQMKLIAYSNINRRECSVQEYVNHVLSGQWVRKPFPGVVFGNSNVPGKRFRVRLREAEISDLPEESKEIFKRKVMDRYIDGPNANYVNGKCAVLDSMCFAEFRRYYYLAKRNNNLDNGYQLKESTNKVIEENHDQHVSYPKLVPLMSLNALNEKLPCRKVPSVLQYHLPNVNTHLEDYYHHMLVLFYLFRREEDLMCGRPPLYFGKIYDSSVLEIVNHN